MWEFSDPDDSMERAVASGLPSGPVRFSAVGYAMMITRGILPMKKSKQCRDCGLSRPTKAVVPGINRWSEIYELLRLHCIQSVLMGFAVYSATVCCSLFRQVFFFNLLYPRLLIVFHCISNYRS